MSTKRARSGTRHDVRGDLPRSAEVIIAEDDDDMRDLVARVLRDEGFEVSAARDGVELLDRIADRLISRDGQGLDLIVTDVRMPGVGGLEVLAGIRQHDWSIPVILMTAFGDAAVHAEAARLGALAVFDKPIDLDALRTVVRGARHP